MRRDGRCGATCELDYGQGQERRSKTRRRNVRRGQGQCGETVAARWTTDTVTFEVLRFAEECCTTSDIEATRQETKL